MSRQPSPFAGSGYFARWLERCKRDSSLCIAVGYLLAGLAWIYGSDYLVGYLFGNSEITGAIGSGKGFLFVTVTALLFYLVLRARLNAVRSAFSTHYAYAASHGSDVFILAEATPPFRIIEINDHASLVYGYSRAEMLGMSIRDLRAEEVRPGIEQDLERFVARHPETPYETVHWRKDGTSFPVEISGRIETYDGKNFIQSVLRDVSERKRSERVLATSRQRTQTLLDSLPDVAWMKDHEGRYVAANQALANFLHVGGAEILGKTSRDLFSPQHAEAFEANERAVIADGKSSILEVGFDTAAGRRWYETIVQPIPLEEDGKFGTVGTAHDITDRKAIEEERRHRAEELVRHERQLQEMLVETIHAMALTVEKRDPYTAGHQGRAAMLAVAIGHELGLSAHQIEGLRLGGMIHDIGKIYIPSEILNRPGRLTEQEMALIRTHPEVGYDIVKDVHFIWPVKEIILQHQERLDGSGYPQGLKGEQIALEARIIAVADVVEAISSHRPYRPALGLEHGLDVIRAGRGTLFDPAAVDACLGLFEEKRFQFQTD